MAKTNNENFLGRCFDLKSAYGTFKKVSFGPEDLKKLNQFAATNKGWCSVLIKEKKSGGDGSSFYCEMDTWRAGDTQEKKVPF